LNSQQPFQSLRVGIGITNPARDPYPGLLSVGTLGFYVGDSSGRTFLVSNNHVLAGANQGSVGEAIVQPGTLDLTASELSAYPALSDLDRLRIARLTAFVPLQYGTNSATPNNTVDAALAELAAPAAGGFVRSTTHDLHRLTFAGSILGVASPFQLEPNGAIQGSSLVYKVGRTTGFTEGNVAYLAGTASIEYQPGDFAYFVDQVVVVATPDNVGPFSDRGDSGSGVINHRHELVGLLFAGSPAQTLVNPIDQVLAQLRAASGIPSLRVVTA
jgi:hypothetical protein